MGAARGGRGQKAPCAIGAGDKVNERQGLDAPADGVEPRELCGDVCHTVGPIFILVVEIGQADFEHIGAELEPVVIVGLQKTLGSVSQSIDASDDLDHQLSLVGLDIMGEELSADSRHSLQVRLIFFVDDVEITEVIVELHPQQHLAEHFETIRIGLEPAEHVEAALRSRDAAFDAQVTAIIDPVAAVA